MRCARLLLVVGLLVSLGLPPAHAGDAKAQTPAPPAASPSRHAISFEDWRFWYHANADRLEAEALGTLRLDRWDADALTRSSILETLRTLVDHHATLHPYVAAQAVRALARSTDSSADVQAIAGLLADPAVDHLIREAAALGLGMLRRTDARCALADADLKRARVQLFSTVSDASAQPRTRGFAALAIGLLSSAEPASSDASARMTDALLRLLDAPYAGQEVPVGLLMALGQQPPSSLSDEGRQALTAAVMKGRLNGKDLPDTTRAHAALTLGTMGGAGVESTLARVVAMRRGAGRNVKRSAAVGWGRLAAQLGPRERRAAEQRILAAIERERDPSTRHFLTMALVQPFTRDLLEADKATVAGGETASHLLDFAARGTYLDRPYGALALGLVLRAVGGAVGTDATRAFRRQALEVLRAGLADRTDTDTRAAFVLALGLSRDAASRDARMLISADPARDGDVRAYALLGLVLEGSDAATHRLALERWASSRWRRHVLVLRALGLAASSGPSVDPAVFLDALVREKTVSLKAEAAIALGRLASPEAAKRLIQVALDPREQDLSRGMAILALGRMADPERVSSLVPLYESVQHRAMTDLTNELLGIQ